MKNHLEKSVQEWCQKGGLRATRTRELLFEVLKDTQGPLSVPELVESLAARNYFPHKTTIYREVEQLVEKGLLTQVQLSETRVSYELSGNHHHHFVCQVCAGVTSLSFCEEVMKTISRTLESQGKHVRKHTFEFFGVCELCITTL